ncbi:MAG: hypothetical protein RR554_11595, partial [Vagococcus sp.]
MKSNNWLKKVNVSMLSFLVLGAVVPTATVLAETQPVEKDKINIQAADEPVNKEAEKKDDNKKEVEVKETEKEVTKPDEAGKETKKLTVLGTSDVHGNVWDWSYEDDKEADLGFAKIGTLVKQERAKNPNNILVDAGDNLQG